MVCDTENVCSVRPDSPVHGSTSCSESPDAVFCSLACQDGFAFAMQPQHEYFCRKSAFDDIHADEVPYSNCIYT